MPHSGGTGGDDPGFPADPDEPEQTEILIAVMTEELLGKKVDEEDIENCAAVAVDALNTRRNVVLEDPSLIGQLAEPVFGEPRIPQAS